MTLENENYEGKNCANFIGGIGILQWRKKRKLDWKNAIVKMWKIRGGASSEAREARVSPIFLIYL